MQSDLSAELARLIERLRSVRETWNPRKECSQKKLRNPDGPDAADTILDQQQRVVALEAEVARLRERPYTPEEIEIVQCAMDRGRFGGDDLLQDKGELLRRARAALGSTPDA